MTVLVCIRSVYVLFFICSVISAVDPEVPHLDKVIEDEITNKLSEDLLQSIEKKFQVDLERSVDSVLKKIMLLLQNGTAHIQDKLAELQSVLDGMRKDNPEMVDECLVKKQNETALLAEKALHQMVVCGYALIGHDPAQAIRNVMELKNTISEGLKPLYQQKEEVDKLLKICGHDHDSLKKVIKCVISKSPQIKSAMMTVSGKLVDGVVHLTKLMAHGAMHEACLIEVIKTVEDEALNLVEKVKNCVGNNGNITEKTTATDPHELGLQLFDKLIGYKDSNGTVRNGTEPIDAPTDETTKDEEVQKILTGNGELTMGNIGDPDKEDLKNELKGEVTDKVKDQLKKLLRRMMSDGSKDDQLKKQLLDELEKGRSLNDIIGAK